MLYSMCPSVIQCIPKEYTAKTHVIFFSHFMTPQTCGIVSENYLELYFCIKIQSRRLDRIIILHTKRSSTVRI